MIHFVVIVHRPPSLSLQCHFPQSHKSCPGKYQRSSCLQNCSSCVLWMGEGAQKVKVLVLATLHVKNFGSCPCGLIRSLARVQCTKQRHKKGGLAYTVMEFQKRKPSSFRNRQGLVSSMCLTFVPLKAVKLYMYYSTLRWILRESFSRSMNLFSGSQVLVPKYSKSSSNLSWDFITCDCSTWCTLSSRSVVLNCMGPKSDLS